MSLILRAKAQPILNDFDLDPFHVGLDHYRNMVIETNCGKPFATVHGVQFSRTNPTAAEMDVSLELLRMR